MTAKARFSLAGSTLAFATAVAVVGFATTGSFVFTTFPFLALYVLCFPSGALREGTSVNATFGRGKAGLNALVQVLLAGVIAAAFLVNAAVKDTSSEAAGYGIILGALLLLAVPVFAGVITSREPGGPEGEGGPKGRVPSCSEVKRAGRIYADEEAEQDTAP